MAEYIDREAFKRVLRRLIQDPWNHEANAGSWADAYREMIDQIDMVPAADVRPVVTCAECKHNNACFTQAFVEDESRVPFDRSTFFCADGKRADNG